MGRSYSGMANVMGVINGLCLAGICDAWRYKVTCSVRVWVPGAGISGVAAG